MESHPIEMPRPRHLPASEERRICLETIPVATLPPKDEPEEDMPSVPPAPGNLPSQTQELSLVGLKEDVGARALQFFFALVTVQQKTLMRLPSLRRSKWDHEAIQALRVVIATNVGARCQCTRRQVRRSLREENPVRVARPLGVC